MNRVQDIYSSIEGDCLPKPRTLGEVRLVLDRSYFLLQTDDFKDLSPLDENANQVVNRVSIERVLADLNHFPKKLRGDYRVSSKEFEVNIRDLEILDTVISSNEKRFEIPLQIKARVYSIVASVLILAKSQLIEIKKRLILESLKQTEGKNQKINFINEQMVLLKQNAPNLDNRELQELIQFLELELEKWKNHLEDFPGFSSAQDLWLFLTNVVDEEICRSITLDGGYKNFWRDQSCTTPKSEAETQQYIRKLFEPHCIKNKINISSESVAANGRVDLTFNYLNFRVCMEIKNAHHENVETAINTQLPLYMRGEKTDFGLYIVLWCKSSKGFPEPRKYATLAELKSKILKSLSHSGISISVLDCTKPESPSRM